VRYRPQPVQRLILVSDDEPVVAESLSQIGKSLDVTVLSEAKGKVVDRARRDKPDLVVLDVQQKDGLELLSLLKTGRYTKDIPVVVVASKDAPDLRELALEVGADAFIPKPLGKDFLPKLLLFLAGKGTGG
jgi:CheY-like chemotaxis protein